MKEYSDVFPPKCIDYTAMVHVLMLCNSYVMYCKNNYKNFDSFVSKLENKYALNSKLNPIVFF